MKFKIPDTIFGQKVEGSIERVLKGQEKQAESPKPSKTAAPANINLKDYVQIPNSGILISKYEQFKGLNWSDTHAELQKNGLFMPAPAVFMPYFLNVADAYQGKSNLYDAEGTQLKGKELEDIYLHLTKDHINNGAYSWLDAYFEKQGNDFYILTENKQKKEKLENCIQEDCFVDFNLNKQGIPTSKSKNQEYEQGKNIYYWYPRDGGVAGFCAGSGRASLCCCRDPGDAVASLGVRACREAAVK